VTIALSLAILCAAAALAWVWWTRDRDLLRNSRSQALRKLLEKAQ